MGRGYKEMKHRGFLGHLKVLCMQWWIYDITCFSKVIGLHNKKNINPKLCTLVMCQYKLINYNKPTILMQDINRGNTMLDCGVYGKSSYYLITFCVNLELF